MYCFRRNYQDGFDSLLWFAQKDTNTLYISNIVPTKLRQLKVDNYNKILIEFSSFGLEECVANLNGSVERTSETYSLEDIMGEGAARNLRLFSSAANKSTGNAHPLDRERWFDFIISVHELNKINSDEIQKFLVEDGWSEEAAFDLAMEFEYSMDLLTHFKGK